MDFLSSGIPLGRYFGINVRLHFTFLIYAWFHLRGSSDLVLALAMLVALYVCILLHEFGHALAARWCDGEAEDILLWPLGGLAMCRPAWHPTAHLITAAAGPFVTLVLGAMFWGLALLLPDNTPTALQKFVVYLAWMNTVLLVFNLIPAFPMDGGRILRDTMWHFMRAETATRIAVWVSRVVAGAGAVYAVLAGQWFLLLLVGFILLQAGSEQRIVAAEAAGTYNFSIRERLKRGARQRAFRSDVGTQREQAAAVGFHRCAVCGLTERDDRHMDFRVCTDCQSDSEYCTKHIDSHTHR
jgi:Zn-dependent protease